MSTLRGITVKNSVDFAIECGFDGIEIQTDYLSLTDKDKEIRYALEKGLSVSLHAPCGDINISALNRGIRKESVSQMKEAIDLAQKHCLRVVTFHPGRLSSARENVEEKLAVLFESVQEISNYAKEKKVYIAIENMENRKKEIVNSIDDLNKFEYFSKENPFFGAAIDFSHLATNKIFVEQSTDIQLPIYNVHISQCVDGKPHYPVSDTGEIDIGRSIDFLKQRGYDSHIVVELKGIFDTKIYRESYNYLRELMLRKEEEW